MFSHHSSTYRLVEPRLRKVNDISLCVAQKFGFTYSAPAAILAAALQASTVTAQCSAWQPLLYSSGTINALTIYNGELIAGGSFYNEGNASNIHVAAWNGSNLHGFGNCIGCVNRQS